MLVILKPTNPVSKTPIHKEHNVTMMQRTGWTIAMERVIFNGLFLRGVILVAIVAGKER